MIESKKFDVVFDSFSVEITRKCDLNCNFCARGKAQNITITKEIIDKTIDELQGVYIHCLRINGGEPFLAQDEIAYLFDQIIEKHIYINFVAIFTNGNNVPDKLYEPFQKMLAYMREIEQETRHIARFLNEKKYHVYPGTEVSKIAVIISDIGHNVPDSKRAQTKSFLDQLVKKDDDFCVVMQTASFGKKSKDIKSHTLITFEGNALDNYKQLIEEPAIPGVTMRMIDDRYCFVVNSANPETQPYIKDTVFIKKTISVSANGNVYPGCFTSYENVDNNPMFNIKSCNHNLFKMIDNWCWQNPVNEKARDFREVYKAYQFCKDQNIRVDSSFIKKAYWYDAYAVITDFYEKTSIDIHSMLPTLQHHEIDMLSIAMTVLDLYNKDIPRSIVNDWMLTCTELDNNDIAPIDAEWCRGFILHMVDIDKQRRAEKGIAVN